MIFDLESLNPNQRVSVEWNEGPLLVLAGPGSGKTRVLTMRIAKLILDSPEKRFRILGLTFTNKAAGEMRNRVEEMVPNCQERVLLTTFHSFCAELLRQHGRHVGIKPDFVILNQESDREEVLKDAINVLNKVSLNINQEDIKLLPSIDRLLANCIHESDVISVVKDKEFGEKLQLLYTEYKKQMIINNRLDFSSLLVLAYQLLVQKPIVAKQIRITYPHICVDEFQDTNLAQYLILKSLVGENPNNLFVVADDDQIIYQWNGASPERLKSLREDFNMKIIQLPANYRCPAEVITLANRLIKYNLERAADKEPLFAVKTATVPNVIRLQHFNSLKEELAWIAQDIKTLHPFETGECAILGRTRKTLEEVVNYLEEVGLKASLTIRKSEFTSTPFRWLHAILRLANARSDKEQLRRICKAFYELEGIDIQVQQIFADSPRFDGDFLRTWFELVKTKEGIENQTTIFLNEGKKQIVERLDVINFIHNAFKWLSIQEEKLAGRQGEGFVDFENEKIIWEDLQRRIMEKYGLENITLNVLLQEFDLSEKVLPIPPDAVRCLTIHSAKGLEFQHVYLLGLAEEILPSFQSIKRGEQSYEMQEERRNCFVAITRAQTTLTLTYSDTYFGWRKKPSRFLIEMELVD